MQSSGIGLQPLQQPGERIMGRGKGEPGLHAFGLRAADSSLGSDQEIRDSSLISTAVLTQTTV
jgi:hypothetical protein